jgi:hypothetical protein
MPTNEIAEIWEEDRMRLARFDDLFPQLLTAFKNSDMDLKGPCDDFMARLFKRNEQLPPEDQIALERVGKELGRVPMVAHDVCENLRLRRRAGRTMDYESSEKAAADLFGRTGHIEIADCPTCGRKGAEADDGFRDYHDDYLGDPDEDEDLEEDDDLEKKDDLASALRALDLGDADGPDEHHHVNAMDGVIAGADADEPWCSGQQSRAATQSLGDVEDTRILLEMGSQFEPFEPREPLSLTPGIEL